MVEGCDVCVCILLDSLCPRAAERCLKEKRKTVTGEDILFAMATLGFDNYIEPLKNFLTKYKEVRVGMHHCSLAVCAYCITMQLGNGIVAETASVGSRVGLQCPSRILGPKGTP